MEFRTENKNRRPHYEGNLERFISAGEIYKDLTKIEKELGSDAVKALCAVVISNLSFWSWPGFRNNFVNDYKKEKGKTE